MSIKSNQKTIIWSDYFLLFILLIGIIFTIFYSSIFNNSLDLNSCKITILLKVDSLDVERHNTIEHNSKLLNLLQKRMQNQQDGITAKIGFQSEARNFYTVILIGIFSIIFSNQKEKKNLQRNMIFLGFAFILIMYLMDIHYKDMIERNVFTINMHRLNIETLVNSYPNNDSWYQLDFSELKEVMDTVHFERIQRKITKVFQPDLAQIVFFIIPLIVMYFFGRPFLRKQNIRTSKK